MAIGKAANEKPLTRLRNCLGINRKDAKAQCSY
jgi:hypothetical protein